MAALRSATLPIEAVVVDDRSQHQLEPVVEPFGARLLRAPGAGISAARNHGAEAARGEYLLFLDDDDYLLPGVVDALLPALQLDPSLDAAYGQIQTTDERLNAVSAPYPGTLDADPFHAFLGRFQQIGTVLCRRSAIATTGPFDQSLVAAEDWDWLLRLALNHRLRCVLVPCLKFRQRPPGAADRMMLERLPLTRQVFWRNVRRAGPRRPPWPKMMRWYVSNNGRWTSLFLSSLQAHMNTDDRKSARFALAAAMRSSPIHVARSLAADSMARSATLRALSPVRRPA